MNQTLVTIIQDVLQVTNHCYRNPPRLDIIEKGESIMGDYLWGW